MKVSGISLWDMPLNQGLNRNETVENNSVAPVANNNNAIGEETDEGEARPQNTEWCRCGNCTPMPTADECVCCQEMADISHRFMDHRPDQEGPECITQNPRLATVCLDTEILDICLLMMSNFTAN